MTLKESLDFIQEELDKLKEIREIIYNLKYYNTDKLLRIKAILERK